MRFALRVVPVAMCGILATAAFGQIDPLQSDVTNTDHNLNNYPGVVLPGNQVCLPCHVPHNAYPYDDEGIDMVLWNHDAPNHTFDMYTTLDGTTPGQPEGPSKMCLGCHDGVTALDSYGGATGSIFFDPDSPVNIGGGTIPGDLTNDHPIGLTYPTGNPGYKDPGGFSGVKLVNIGGDNRVECTSCHEPHNNHLGKFLRRELNNSFICLECHRK